MSHIPDGVYAIFYGGRVELVTAFDPRPGSRVNIYPPDGNPAEQNVSDLKMFECSDLSLHYIIKWAVENLPNGNITITNKQSGLYLSYEGSPEDNKPIILSEDRREWRLQYPAELYKFWYGVSRTLTRKYVFTHFAASWSQVAPLRAKSLHLTFLP